MRYLKTNTATIVTIGPFLDKTDGVTLKTALTITNERISFTVDLNDGSAPTLVLDNITGATSGTSNDLNYITGNDAALMQLELSAANTNYLGRAFLTITDAANHCPVFHEFTILPALVYDSIIAGTDNLQVDTIQVSGTTQTARDIGTSVLLSSGTGTGQISLSSGTVTAGTINDKTGYSLTATTGLGNQTANITGTITTATNVTTVNGLATGVINAASIAAGAITSTDFAAGAITAASIAAGAITSTDFASGAITAASIATDAISAAAVSAAAVTKIQTGLATPTNITAGTITTVTNLTNAPTVGDLTATMKTSVTTAATAATPTAAAVTGAVGSVTGNVTGSIGSLATQAKADVNAEVVDVLRTDTLPDSYSAHEAQPTFAQAVLAIHQFLMEREVSSTSVTVQKPDGSTTAMTLTLNSATDPTTVHRSA
jgi:hypothetical protein